MKAASRRMALCGMMAALAVVIMMLGGMIPLATFCCPALAALTLVPVLVEFGRKWALSAYAAVAALSLMLCPDKEAALLFEFLGYYPALKPSLDRIRLKSLRIAAKLGIFNLAAGAMLLTAALVFDMRALAGEYAAMGLIGGIAFATMANVTMLLYDRAVVVMAVIYIRKFRRNLTRGR